MCSLYISPTSLVGIAIFVTKLHPIGSNFLLCVSMFKVFLHWNHFSIKELFFEIMAPICSIAQCRQMACNRTFNLWKHSNQPSILHWPNIELLQAQWKSICPSQAQVTSSLPFLSLYFIIVSSPDKPDDVAPSYGHFLLIREPLRVRSPLLSIE